MKIVALVVFFAMCIMAIIFLPEKGGDYSHSNFFLLLAIINYIAAQNPKEGKP